MRSSPGKTPNISCVYTRDFMGIVPQIVMMDGVFCARCSNVIKIVNVIFKYPTLGCSLVFFKEVWYGAERISKGDVAARGW